MKDKIAVSRDAAIFVYYGGVTSRGFWPLAFSFWLLAVSF